MTSEAALLLELPEPRRAGLARTNLCPAPAEECPAVRDRQDAKTPRREPDEEVDGLTRMVVDAAMKVHRVLGLGFGENVYERGLSIELSLRRIPFSRQPMTERQLGLLIDFDVVRLASGLRRVVLSPSL